MGEIDRRSFLVGASGLTTAVLGSESAPSIEASIPEQPKEATIRVGAYQGPVIPGDREANAREALRVLAEGAKRNLHFACLPESYISGYDVSEVLRRAAVSVEDPWFRKFVQDCAFGDTVSILGFTERRGELYHNSAAIIQAGRLLGIYRKAYSGGRYERETFTFGREFPVFDAHGVRFGVLICADGGYPEIARILALKGARILFAPHYNYIPFSGVQNHRTFVRSDHTARARENGCYFVKANSVTLELRPLGEGKGVGYGESYILGPDGASLAESGLFTTGWITAEIPRTELTKERRSPVANLPRAIWEQMRELYEAQVSK